MAIAKENEQKQKALSQKRFGEFAESYVKSQTHARGKDLDQLLIMADPHTDWRVLDVATGGGHTALLFAPFVAAIVATDISPKMLEAAKAFLEDKRVQNVRFQVAEADRLPFTEKSFDLVTCRIASHHFPSCAAFIGEAWRVLKPAGLCLLQDHFLPESEADGRYIDTFERLRDPSHNRAYSKSEWMVLFRKAGFEIKASNEVIKTHEFQPWAERQHCTAETKEQLLEMLKNASPVVQDWLRPQDLSTENPSFINHHLLMLGTKT